MRTKLAIHGGTPVITETPRGFSEWPILTAEDEQAVLEVLRSRGMSGTEITFALEKEYAAWIGSAHALACNNGTAAIHCAMYGLGIGRGAEVITPTWTFWATHTPLLNLGATPVFCDLDPRTLCPDPADAERRITPRTRAILVVHMFGHPADMDAFMEISRRRGIPILEDYSHAHGSTWKGRKAGSIAQVGAASIMTEKPLAAGEGGMLNTDDRGIYERAIMLGHGDHHALVRNPDFKRFATVPFGGCKYRMHQMTSAVARVQLRHFDTFRQPGLRALERFFRAVTRIPGVAGNYPLDDPRITVGSSYAQRLILSEEIVARVPVAVIAEALRAEGVSDAVAGGYPCHHLLPFWNECDVYGDGKPTRIAFTDRDVRQGPGDCPQAERAAQHLVSVPRMVRYDEPHLDRLIEAYHKVLTHLEQLEGLTSQDAITRWRTSH